jgi:uncharacterized membrane protein YeiB
VLLALVPLFRRLPTRGLLVAALVSFALPSLVTATIDDNAMREALQPDTYSELRDLPEIARQLLWTGGYPLVGWAGFAFVGLWLARLPLSQAGTQRRLLIGGILLAAVQPVAGAFVSADANGFDAFLDSTAHSNQFAWYVSATGSAVAVIALCLMVAPRFAGALRPVARLGAMALSAYLLHLFIGAHAVWPWEDEVEPSLAAQMVLVLIVFATFAIAADAWSRKFRRGPVESLLRAISR